MEPVAPHLVDVRLSGFIASCSGYLRTTVQTHRSRTMARLGLLDILFPEVAPARGSPAAARDRIGCLGPFRPDLSSGRRFMSDPGSHLQPIAGAVVEIFGLRNARRVKWAALLHAIWEPAMPGVPLEHGRPCNMLKSMLSSGADRQPFQIEPQADRLRPRP